MNRALSAFIVLLVLIGAAIAGMLLVLDGVVVLLAASIGQGRAQIVIGLLVLALLALLLMPRRPRASIKTASGLPLQLPAVVRQRPLESCGIALLAGIVIGARPEILGEASRALTEVRQTLKDLEHGD